jgi:hypothetical protein
MLCKLCSLVVLLHMNMNGVQFAHPHTHTLHIIWFRLKKKFICFLYFHRPTLQVLLNTEHINIQFPNTTMCVMVGLLSGNLERSQSVLCCYK